MQVVWAQKRQSRNGNHREVRYDNHSFTLVQQPLEAKTSSLPQYRDPAGTPLPQALQPASFLSRSAAAHALLAGGIT